MPRNTYTNIHHRTHQVTEEEYATLVAKRRKENANFVVGAEENDEYVDMGEEED